MLAGVLKDPKTLDYPVYCTPKLDGIRCLVFNKKALTRKFKSIPNHHVRNLLENSGLDGCDGELIAPNKSFNETQSLIMTEEGTPEFEYHVFDYIHPNDLSNVRIPSRRYIERMTDLEDFQKDLKGSVPFLRFVLPVAILSVEELNTYEQKCLSEGYEGIMIRSGNGPYKCGRSTTREGYLLKYKRFLDSEAVVVGFTEREHNENEAEEDELGYTKRSHSKTGMVGANTLGSILVKDPKFGDIPFGIGTGFDDALRKEIWENRKKYLGKLVSYKYQTAGMKDFPRFPVFRGFRSPLDT